MGHTFPAAHGQAAPQSVKGILKDLPTGYQINEAVESPLELALNMKNLTAVDLLLNIGADKNKVGQYFEKLSQSDFFEMEKTFDLSQRRYAIKNIHGVKHPIPKGGTVTEKSYQL